MIGPRTEKLLSALRAYCEAADMRQVALARKLGVSKQVLNTWLGTPARHCEPSCEHALAIIELLRREKRRDRRRKAARRTVR